MQVSTLFGASNHSPFHKPWLPLAGAALFLAVPAFAQNLTSASADSLPNAPSTENFTVPALTVSHSLTFGERAQIYARSVFSPGTIIGPAFGAGIGQWRDEPPEWGESAQGYGRRVASGIGRDLFQKTITFGFAAIDGEDPRFLRSTDSSAWGVTKNAITWGFVSPTASGRKLPALSKWVGFYGSAFISNAWYPEYPANRDTAGNAAVRGSTALAASIGWHVVRSFLPFRRDDAGR